LIEACTERLWLVADGGVVPFDGDLDDYRRFVLGEGGKQADQRPKGGAAQGGGRAEVRRAAAQMRIELAPLRRRIADAEMAVKRYGEEIARLDAALAVAGLFARDPAKAAALAKARADAATALARAEDDWLTASGEYEAASA
jgi:ATP-binding cassette subfamily F protein 3